MKRMTLLIASLFFLGALSLVVSTSAKRQPTTVEMVAQAQATSGQSGADRRAPKTRENFDIRAGRMAALDAVAETSPVAEANAQASKPTFKRATATSKLERRLPGLQMKWSTLSQAPSRIWGFTDELTPPSGADSEAIVRGFLKENNDLYQLSGDEVDGLQVARRYRTDHNGLTHITLGQQAGGLEVFQADLTVHLNNRGAVIAASGELIANAVRKASASQPKMTAAEALQIAARDVDEAITGALNLSDRNSVATRALATMSRRGWFTFRWRRTLCACPGNSFCRCAKPRMSICWWWTPSAARCFSATTSPATTKTPCDRTDRSTPKTARVRAHYLTRAIPIRRL